MREKGLVSMVWEVISLGERAEKDVNGIDFQKYKDIKTSTSGLRFSVSGDGRPRKSHQSFPNSYIYIETGFPKRIVIECESEAYLKSWIDELRLPGYNQELL